MKINLLKYPPCIHAWILEGFHKQLEHYEQIAFCEWLASQNLKFTSIPNSTFSKSIKQKAKNTALGLNSGFPDLVVVIPREMSKNASHGYLLLVEMKRVNGGSLTSNQKEWIDALNTIGDQVVAHHFRGADAAIEFTQSFLGS